MNKRSVDSAALAAAVGIPWALVAIVETGLLDARIAHPVILATSLAAVAALTIRGLLAMREVKAYAARSVGPDTR
jgi:hypothetical protein